MTLNFTNGCGRPTSSRHRARIVDTGNQMAQRCWQRYRFSHDDRYADLAEWWRVQTEKALERQG